MKNTRFSERFTDYSSRLNRDYLTDVRRRPRCTADEEDQLALRAQRGDQKALGRLVDANLGLVVSVAKQYAVRGYELMDVVSEGNAGLIEAAKRYMPGRGARFGSYAAHWVRKRILQQIDEMKDDDAMSQSSVSLSSPIQGGDGDSVLEDMVADPSAPSPSHCAEQRDLHDRLHAALAQLPDRQRLIVVLAYGFDGVAERTIRQISTDLGLHRSVVTAEHKQALETLRRNM
ncbi:MAG: sigma-70 family RNA polymerase sigma factor [Bacteroidales bacterium]|nr:sigma-70 family RNA polymerase sigma factor [Candidatus Physcousia equi]